VEAALAGEGNGDEKEVKVEFQEGSMPTEMLRRRDVE